MRAYTQSKIYKSLYGDLTPIIVANVLGINIGIVSYINETLVIDNIPTDSSENVKTVYVYKTGEHYDAILPVVPSVMYNGGGQRSSMVTNTNSFQVKCPYDLCDGKNHAEYACVSADGKKQRLFDEFPCVGKQSKEDIVGVTADNPCNDEGYMRHIGCDTLRSDERRDMGYSYSGDDKKTQW